MDYGWPLTMTYDAALPALLSAPAPQALADIQSEVFDAKVSFLYSLAPLRPLREDVVRKLAPCFQV
jgi:hypothetical protein